MRPEQGAMQQLLLQEAQVRQEAVAAEEAEHSLHLHSVLERQVWPPQIGKGASLLGANVRHPCRDPRTSFERARPGEHEPSRAQARRRCPIRRCPSRDWQERPSRRRTKAAEAGTQAC